MPAHAAPGTNRPMPLPVGKLPAGQHRVVWTVLPMQYHKSALDPLGRPAGRQPTHAPPQVATTRFAIPPG